MLDFDRLKTPPNHGDTLVEPSPPAIAAAAESNRARLDGLSLSIGGVDLPEHRRALRRDLVGDADGLVLVTGHQPEFIHPGVWAKHVVAARAAEAMGGRAINLVVDSDVAKDTRLHVPTVADDGIQVRAIRFADVPVGTSYEDIPAADGPTVARLRSEVAGVMGDRFADSLMSDYLTAMVRAPAASDWVDQKVYARKQIEGSLGVELTDHRVGQVWFGPLLAEMLCNPHRFAACYNAALGEYRARYRVRSPQRPIPDLAVDGPRCEVAAWIATAGRPRRRLYVERVADTVRLFAGHEQIASWAADRVRCWKRIWKGLEELAGVRIRPRALTLTMWARLFLADLFIHGIGGAKYDRITDRLIRCYFGIEPPAMACVSATLTLDLPHDDVRVDDVRRRECQLRSLRYNPQRHLDLDGALAELASTRAAAVVESARLRAEDRANRPGRRGVFERIRSASNAMLAARPEVVAAYEADVARVHRRLRDSRIARRRDFFFGLFSRSALAGLLDRLPAPPDFRV